MKLFIGSKEVDQPATPRFFNILDVDEHSLAPQELRVYQTESNTRSGNMRNWGFAWYADHLYAPNRTKGLVKYDRDLNVLANYLFPVAGHTPVEPGKSVRNAAQFDRPHQVACLGRKIYVCDSGHNLLKVFDPDTKTFRSIGFDPRKNWINSVNLIDDEINIVFHNHGWSDLVVLDTDLRPKYEKRRIGICAHHVWWMNGERWTCSSREGTLRAIDSDRVIQLGGYLRGVAIFDRYLIVGVSRERNSNSLDQLLPQPTTAHREISTSGLVFLDMKTLSVAGTIEFQDLANAANYRMPYIFEVRVVDVLDDALRVAEPLSFGNIERFLYLRRTLAGN